MTSGAGTSAVSRWRRLAGGARSAGGDFAWTAGGKAVMVGANAVLLVGLARLLEVPAYGLFATAVGAQVFLSRVLLMGLDSGVIRLASVPELRERPQQVIAAGFRILGAAAAVLLACVVLAAPAAQAWQPAWPAWVPAAVVGGAAAMALVDYATSCRLSALRYPAAAYIQGGVAVVRLLAAIAAAAIRPSAAAVILAYTGANLAFGLAQLPPLPVREPVPQGLARRLLLFSVRIGVSDMLVALSLHQGSFLLLLLGDRTQLGIYGLALSLSLAGHALMLAFFQTVYPRMSATVASPKALPAFLLRATGAALGLAAAGIPVVIAVAAVLPRFVRPGFAPAAGVFYWLAAAVLVSVVQAPLVAAALYLLRPNFLIVVNLVRVAATGGLGLALAPSDGAMGAAVAQLGGSVAGAAVLAVLVLTAIRTASTDSLPSEPPPR